MTATPGSLTPHDHHDHSEHRRSAGGPMLISHRANMKVAPENTIAGIRSALDACVDGIEIDVQATADGLVVLMHDCSMHRATGDRRLVSEVSADETRSLRVIPPRGDVAPEPIATLEEALTAVGGSAVLVLDIKMEQIGPLVAKVIRDSGVSDSIRLQCDLDEAAEYRALLPGVPITVGLRAGAIKRHGLVALLDQAVALGVTGVSIRNRILDQCAVDEAHRRGLTVKTWTVDRERDLERVMATGVDAVCGNYPQQMRGVRERIAARRDTDREAPPDG